MAFGRHNSVCASGLTGLLRSTYQIPESRALGPPVLAVLRFIRAGGCCIQGAKRAVLVISLVIATGSLVYYYSLTCFPNVRHRPLM